MDALQQRLFTILREVDRICKLHSIRYYLISGTALGAVRHHGFIPWDDDLDVGMLRPDYERFLHVCKDSLGPDFFLQYWRTEPNHCLPFAKIRLNRTTFISKDQMHLSHHQGIFLDVFPLDGLPKCHWVAAMQQSLQRFLHILLEVAFINVPNPGFRNRMLKRLLRPLLPGAQINRLYNAVSRLVSVETASQTVFMAPGKFRPTYPRTWFSDPAHLPFEGNIFPVPKEYHAYLERTYGDYMVPPPLSEQNIKHASIVDPDRDYRHYLP